MPYDPVRHGAQRIVGPGFHEQVFALVRLIPRGRVSTYGDVGTQLGSVRVARHVGYALAALPARRGRKPVPWHRVVNSRGRLSFPLGDPRADEQRAALAREGVIVDELGRVAEFARRRHRFAKP
ncbi:MAG: MGMT family protein [Planctomycetota bacterium]